MTKNFIWNVRILVLFLMLWASPVGGQSYLVQLQTDNYLPLRYYLEQRGYDVAGYNPHTGELGVVTEDPKSLEELQAALCSFENLRFTIASVTASEPFSTYTQYDIEGYFDAEKTVEELEKMEQLYPQWAKVYNLNHWLGVPLTEEGRTIYGLQVSTNPAAIEDEPKVMFVGLHHCREVMTHHAVLDAAWDLLKGAAQGNAKYRAWIEDSAVWFVPVANPDGLEYVFSSDRMWRKNRSRNPDGSRGVDLNRNYEFLWGKCGSNSSTGSSNVYKGPAPQSEPEVQLMDRLNARLRCQYLISYHSYGDEVLYPYLCANLMESELYYMIRDELANHLAYGKRYASSSGEDFEQHYHHYGTISFLLEIGTSFQPSYSSYRGTVWPTVQKVLPFIMEELHKPYIHLKVTETGSGKPLPAAVAIEEIAFKEGEKRTADEHGSYRWRLMPGTCHFTVSMKGYGSKTFAIQAGKHIEHHVELEKTK